ncbi:hypothetical protein JD969_04700 [Planctomycetota bacterium]|nr:hypothetical protein JD969_04700 [Planctomycetota bacterium]
MNHHDDLWITDFTSRWSRFWGLLPNLPFLNRSANQIATQVLAGQGFDWVLQGIRLAWHLSRFGLVRGGIPSAYKDFLRLQGLP